jgi:hypothetical protein
MSHLLAGTSRQMQTLLKRVASRRLRRMDANAIRFMNIDGSPAVKVESRSDVSDDEREAGKVASRARLRIAELLQRPLGVRSIALTGLFILAVFYTIYFMRSILLPIVLALLLSYLLRPIVRGLAQLKIPLPVGAAFILIGLLALVAEKLATTNAETTTVEVKRHPIRFGLDDAKRFGKDPQAFSRAPKLLGIDEKSF